MIRGSWEIIFARNIYAGSLLEAFMVTAITAVLAIRFFLGITGYPQVGGGGLHIAHVLVGGFFMLASILILLIFLGNYSRSLAAFLGGFGFGAFIDELGKFITSDNDYFFKPSIGLIYITFILLFVFIRRISNIRYLTEKEKQANFLEISKDFVLRGDDTYRILLSESIPGRTDNQKVLLKNSDKTAENLGEILSSFPPSSLEPVVYTNLKRRVDKLYSWMIRKTWFIELLIGYFFLKTLASLIEAIYVNMDIENAIFWGVFTFLVSPAIYIILISAISTTKKVSYSMILIVLTSIFSFAVLDLTLPPLSLIDWLHLGFTGLAAGFSVAGILSIRKNRLKAYHLLESSVLIYIFFVHVFNFFEIQLYGLFGLSVDLITLIGLRYMIAQETRKESEILNQPKEMTI
ncbi:MAG: hypothetical protein ACPK85_05505 [Methanosarcina sp.]